MRSNSAVITFGTSNWAILSANNFKVTSEQDEFVKMSFRVSLFSRKFSLDLLFIDKISTFMKCHIVVFMLNVNRWTNNWDHRMPFFTLGKTNYDKEACQRGRTQMTVLVTRKVI